MSGVKSGSCKDAGFGKMVKQAEIQPHGSPQKMKVTIMAAESTCHCHSYEKIACGADGDALYKEHITEIETHCSGVIKGSVASCPYKCYQPFEVLHLHYLECRSRLADSTYLKVNRTARCHKAAQADSDAECAGADGGLKGSTGVSSAREHGVKAVTLIFAIGMGISV